MGALSNLKEETKGLITPIIESKMIPAKEVSDWQSIFRTLGTYISDKIGETNFIYDFHLAFEKIGEVQELIDSKSSKNMVEQCIEELVEADLDFIPCIHFDDPGWIVDSVLCSSQSEIAIRIRYHDFNSPLEEMIVERITDKIINQATNKSFILLLDFYNSPINENRIISTLNNFAQIKASKMVLLLTVCPENADKVSPNTFSFVKSRNDLKTYFKLRDDYPTLEYGDYTVRLKPPLESSNINYYNIYLKIFYSSEDDYYIGKRWC